MLHRMQNPRDQVDIALVGKYVEYEDSYKSLKEALLHGGIAHNVKVNIHWIEAESFEKGRSASVSWKITTAFWCPGGFGKRGIEGMINAIEYARVKKVPYFGICLGMQTMVIEYARNVCGLAEANSTEFNPADAAARDLQTARTERHRRTGRNDAPGRMALRAEAGQLRLTKPMARPRSASAIGIGTNSTASSKKS